MRTDKFDKRVDGGYELPEHLPTLSIGPAGRDKAKGRTRLSGRPLDRWPAVHPLDHTTPCSCKTKRPAWLVLAAAAPSSRPGR